MNTETLSTLSETKTRNRTLATAYAEFCRSRSRLRACHNSAGAIALRWTDYLLNELVLVKKNPAYVQSLQRPSHRLGIRRAFYSFLFFIENRSFEGRRFDIAFVPINDSHLKVQVPVAKALRQRGMQILFISPRRHFRSIVEGNGFSFHWINDALFATDEIFQDVLRMLEDEDVQFLIKKRRARIENWEKYFDLAVRRFCLQAVVVGNDMLTECRIAAAISKNHHLPVFCIQHGSMNRLNPIYVESVSDRYYVYGDVTRQQMMELGMDGQRLIVAGAPSLEEDTSTGSNEPVWQQLGVNRKRIGLVLLSGAGHSTSRAHWERIVKAIISAARHFQDVQFIFKLHPKERIHAYREISDEIVILDNQSLASKNLTLYDLLKSSDFVVTGASASAVEAMTFDKPVFTIDLMHEYSEADFILAGATVHSITPEQFMNNLQKFLSERGHFEATFTSARDFSQRFFHQPKHAKPSQFIAEDISRIIGYGHPRKAE